MQAVLSHVGARWSHTALSNAKELFRAQFQRALRSCVRRRFSVAECFGVIWMETLEEIPLSELEQTEIYQELMTWANAESLPRSYSPSFTGFIHRPAPPESGNP
jgi:hypothetical protein